MANGEVPSSFTACAAVAVSVTLVASAASTLRTATTAAIHRRRPSRIVRWSCLINDPSSHVDPRAKRPGGLLMPRTFRGATQLPHQQPAAPPTPRATAVVRRHIAAPRW
ncbi:hypothetical protein GCM10009753_68480 [Streptantibioticus ferralitis]